MVLSAVPESEGEVVVLYGVVFYLGVGEVLIF